MARTIEKINVEDCGCFQQRITDTWMGEPIVYYNTVLCSACW